MSAHPPQPIGASVTLDLPSGEQSELFECGMQTGGESSEPVRWRFANAEYNERSHELTVAGVPVAVEPKPLEVLLCLLRAEGELVTKDEIFETVWAGRVVTDGVLSQAIRRIREVLGDSGRTMLRTVHGYGFRLDVPIEIEGREDPGTQLQLKPGQSLPSFADWILEERLQTRPANELWRVRHRRDGSLRVIKLALDERAQRALKREVTLNKVLRAELGDGAPVVPLLDWHFDSVPAWIQMPWYQHGSLVDWLAQSGGPSSLDMRRRLDIVAEAAEALAQAHELGVMHKDIKPGNLLVEWAGTEPRLLLCDFGSGTVKSRERLEQSGVTVMGFTKTVNTDASTSGTPAYMAPEVLKGGVFSEQSDIYALGILLYQLVIGDINEPMAAGWEEDVSDPVLREIIAEACAGKPARRIPNMRDLAARVRGWSPQTAPASATETAPAHKLPGAMPGIIAALVVLGLALVFWWQQSMPPLPDNAPVPLVQEPDAKNQRVAILAFELLGLDAQTETVMAGLQDALLADLASVSGRRLVQGQNLGALGLTDASSDEIGRALDAERLIRGSVQQAGEQLRVNLQIVDASRGEAVWGQVITGTRGDLFAIQSEIAQALAAALGTSLESTAAPAVSNAAYEAYLAALSLWKKGPGTGFGEENQVARELDKALALEPTFIDAHLLALLQAARDYWFSAASRRDSESRIAAHLTALEDLETPPVKLATARAVRRYYLDHDPRGGVEILAPFRRVLVRNTESAMFYAYMLRRIGRIDDAFSVFDEVIAQDPSALSPVETKAELLAFQGRGAEAIAVLQNAQKRFGEQSHAVLKIASYGYQLTGDLRFIDAARRLLEHDENFLKLRDMVDMEVARRRGDLQTVRTLARKLEGEDKMMSGHGRMPKELVGAMALKAGGAPLDEVHALAEIALTKLEEWRGQSDSDARRSTMAVALGLLGHADRARALSAEVEAAFPLERDELEAADRIRDASNVHALLGDDAAVLERLQKLRVSSFYALSLCSIPYDIGTQSVWALPEAKAYITAQCGPLWSRNREELAPALAELEAR